MKIKELKTSPFLIILIAMLVAAAFVIGSLSQKVRTLEGGKSGTGSAGKAAVEVPSQPTTVPVVSVAPFSEADHVYGDTKSLLTWIEYSDLQCPFCSTIHPNLKKVIDEFRGQVKWVYRHFPLDSIHPQARPAAIASECVAKLAGNDAFWKFIDGIFANQAATLTPEAMRAAAVKLGANGTQYDSCLTDKNIADAVEADLQSGLAAGVNGTPGSFLIAGDGKSQAVPGAVPYEQLKQTVEAAL